MRAYLSRQPDARRRQEAQLLREMLPALKRGNAPLAEDAEGDEDDGSEAGSSFSSSHQSYLDKDEGDSEEEGNGMGPSGAARNLKLLIALAVAILADAFAADPAQAIVVDESQFLDSLSWQLVMEVRKAVRPCFVVLGFRPGFHGQTHGRTLELHAEQGLAFIPLGPLNADEVQELAAKRLRTGSHAPVEITEAFWERVADAQGHPLVVSELIRLWLKRGRMKARAESSPDSSLDAAGFLNAGRTLSAGPARLVRGRYNLHLRLVRAIPVCRVNIHCCSSVLQCACKPAED